VDEVVLERVIDDGRFNTYGVPRNKTKSTRKAGDRKETVPNANYLWIGMFATALNEHGKAALVMANSASDAGGSELEIRKRMIEDGIISQMVTLPANMFSTVTLPATLWFFNKQKKNKDEILFIDARNIFTQVDRAHRRFSDEQIRNLGIISRLYEGDSDSFWALVEEYKATGRQSEADWLLERWPEGRYRDVTGLCKVAKLEGEDGIIDQDYSLNAGRYVGVVIEDDGMTEEEFAETMKAGHAELKALNDEAETLMAEIEKNMKDLFGEG
ncbi:MAG: SAM-dependent methyltransferase, partial [Prevotella sp.]|nr:SAM-dependent methyltransferase [Prevotella sp.]